MKVITSTSDNLSNNLLEIPVTIFTDKRILYREEWDGLAESAKGLLLPNDDELIAVELKDSFDVLYEEGAEAPKMMSVGLHCRVVGRPGRFRALQRFLDYIQQYERVWVCRRIDIARHWKQVHPFQPD